MKWQFAADTKCFSRLLKVKADKCRKISIVRARVNFSCYCISSQMFYGVCMCFLTLVDMDEFTQSSQCHNHASIWCICVCETYDWFLFLGCNAEIYKLIYVNFLPYAVLNVETELVSNLDSFPQMVMWFWMVWCMWTWDLIHWICHVLLVSSSSCTDAQLYELPGATKAHGEKAAVPKSLR